MSTKLQKARLAVMAAVPYVQKTSSRGLNYSFLGEADLIRVLQPAMVQQRMTVHPEAIHFESSQEYLATNGKRMVNVRARVVYVFQVEEDTARVEVLAEASDVGDKASSKMMTMALKYALRQFFLLETGDDPDTVTHERLAEQEWRKDEAEKAISAASSNEDLEKLWHRCRRFSPGERTQFKGLIESRRKELADGKAK